MGGAEGGASLQRRGQPRRRQVPANHPGSVGEAVESVIKALVERNQQKTLHPSIMGFAKGRGRELAIFNLVETILHRDIKQRWTGQAPKDLLASLGRGRCI